MSKADRKAFVDLPWRLYADDPHWVPPLKDEVYSLITPGKNPFFGHAEAQYFLARRGGRVVGRVSAHLDHLALAQPAEQGMGPGTGNFGLFEAEDAETGAALIATAEGWLRAKGMIRALGPISLSIWRSEEHTSELQSLMRTSYAVYCLKKKKKKNNLHYNYF